MAVWSFGGMISGAAGGDRTHDPWLRRPILYPLSYSRNAEIFDKADFRTHRTASEVSRPIVGSSIASAGGRRRICIETCADLCPLPNR